MRQDLGEPEVAAGALRRGRWSGPRRGSRGSASTGGVLAELLVEVDGPGGVRSTWMVSMPARSLKNQPQDVYMRSALRWASRSTPAWWPSPTMWRRGELVPRHGADQQPEVVVAGRPRVAQQLRPRAARTPRCPSRAARRGRGAAARATPGSSPRARRCGSRSRPSTAATPWAQDQALVRTRTSVVGGDSSSRSTSARHPHAVGGLGDRQGLRHDLVGAVVVVAERLAVGGGDHEPAEVEGGVDDAPARRRLEGEGVGERAVVDDEVDGAVGVVGVAPAVEAAARRRRRRRSGRGRGS